MEKERNSERKRDYGKKIPILNFNIKSHPFQNGPCNPFYFLFL